MYKKTTPDEANKEKWEKKKRRSTTGYASGPEVWADLENGMMAHSKNDSILPCLWQDP